MGRFVGRENVKRGREYLEQLDPELHRYIMDFVYGEVYAGDALNPKTRALCTVAMLATLGQQLQLGVYVQAAHRQGASEEEIREVLRQVAVLRGVSERLERAGDDEGVARALRRDRPGGPAVSFSLELTDAQQALRTKTHAFARDVIRPAAAEYDQAQEMPWPILQEAARQGLYGWELYAELSVDPTGLSLPILMEELFWGCAGIGLSIVMPALALAAIRQAATDDQLVLWAPQCFGTPDEIKLAALAVTEPSGGSDVRSIQTRARQDGDDWVIDGQKVFIGNGGIADVHVVVATVDPEAGHRGQGVFIVPKGTPGLTLLRKLDKLGCRASHTAEIVFEDCRVPDDHLLGGEQRLAERIAKGREAEQGSPPPASTAEEGGTEKAVQRRSSAALGPFERTRPMVAARAIAIARAALESRATTPSHGRRSVSRSSRTRASPSPSPN